MTKEILNVVHFGSGKLGLGFVIPNIASYQNPDKPIHIILAARHNKNDEKKVDKRRICETLRNECKYSLCCESSNGSKTREIKNLELIYIDEEKNKLIDYLSSPKTVLITTAVGSGISKIAEVIAQGLSKRAENSHNHSLVIVACENSPINSETLQSDVIKYLSKEKVDITKTLSDISFQKAIVDRVCPEEPKMKSDGTISISVEEFSEWIVLDKLGTNNIIKSIPSIKSISSEQEFDFLEKRKKWLVNSTHVVTAFYAVSDDIYKLQSALNVERNYNKIRSIQEGFIIGLYHFGFETQVSINESQLDSLREYADSVLFRLKEGPEDTTVRILKEWFDWNGGLEEFRLFFRKAFSRVGDPIKFLIERGKLENKPHVTSALTEFLYIVMDFLSKK